MFEMGTVWVIVLDLVCLVLVSLPFAVLSPQNKPFQRGFFCDDDSIKYPFKGDTISYQLLGGIMIPFTLLVVIVGEYLYVRAKLQSLLRWSYLSAIYKAVGSFVFGLMATMSLTDIAKYSIGRLRPHFLSVCQPVYNQTSCLKGDYIVNFNCSQSDSIVNEARVSFYSGHSSFSMYCMMFVALYLQARMQMCWARLLRPTAQFLLVAAAVYVGLTRVSDYMHHWSDVLIGLLQGGLFGVLAVLCVSGFFNASVKSTKSEEIAQDCRHESPAGTNHYGSTH